MMKIKIFSQLNKIYLTPPHVKGEDGSATSPVSAFPDPRGSLSSTIPAKQLLNRLVVQKATQSVAGAG